MSLTTSLLCWGKVSWLCCLQVDALVSYWFDNLGFFLRENLLLYSSYLPLGVSQRTCDPRTSNLFSSALAGDLRHHLIQQISSPVNSTSLLAPLHLPDSRSIKLLQGESHTSNLFTLFIVLLSLLLLCFVCFLY